jgi:ethanolamine permease
MAEEAKNQVSYEGVSYETVGKEYFEKRGLQRHARVWSLWALGVAAVISGDFSGWNLGIGEGGFGGLFIATLFITVMYIGLCYSIAEMAPALPHTGGAYSFGRSAMGPWGGFFTGLGENMEYILTPAVVIFFTGSYLGSIFETPTWFAPIWWLIGYVVFVGLNIWGVAASFRFTIFICFLALAVLVILYIGAIPHFDFTLWALNLDFLAAGETASLAAGDMLALPDGGTLKLIEGGAVVLADGASQTLAAGGTLDLAAGDQITLPNGGTVEVSSAAKLTLAAGGGDFLPKGVMGIAWALPFAIWFYLAIEELPLAAEESYDPKKDMPKGIMLGLGTLILTGFLVLFLNTGIEPGAAVIGYSGEPVLDGFRTIFGEGVGPKVLGLIAVAGLIASFHTIVFAYGRNIYSLSRAGYFPRWLSVTHGDRKTPHVALIAGGALGFGVMLIVWLVAGAAAGGAIIGGTLLYMAVFGAVISYTMQCLSFIFLRQRLPHIERPYRSPVGVAGAWIALIIAVVTLIFMFTNDSYRPGIIWTAVWYLLGLLYFGLIGRHKLVYSPEEDFAVRERQKALGHA